MATNLTTSRAHRIPMPARVMLAALVACALVLVLAPTSARADDDYSITKVDIDATVATDGTITVVEDRTFDFSGSFNGVYWDIPDGSYDDRDVTVDVTSMGEVVDGRFSAFKQASSASKGDDGVFTARETTTDSGTSVTEAKIFSPQEDEVTTFRMTYTISGVTSAWADTGELYWKYVSDGWAVESEDVTCTVHLPVAAGATVTGGDNVRAWGHGPLDGTVSFSGNDVVFHNPGVGSSDYAEARITFPVSWLSAMTPGTTSKLDSILSEEQQWADDANAQRTRAQVMLYGVIGIVLAGAVLGFLNVFRVKRRYAAAHAPQFSDPYFRDVPSADHPCVLGVLWNGGTVPDDDFTAALMSLTDKDALGLEKVEREKRPKEDYRLTLQAARADALDDPCDKATVAFLRDMMSKDEAEGDATLDFSQIKKIAKKHPESYNESLTEWQDTIKGAAEARGLFTDDSKTGAMGLGILSMVEIVVAVSAFVGLIFMGIFSGGSLATTIVALVACLALAAAGGFGLVSSGSMEDLSREAIEIKAKMAALKKWLCEFTLLKEAVPTDVVLWDRLLVMAVVLGVADKVIDQLKVAAPEVLADPGLMPVYGWYYLGYGGLGRPADLLGQSFESAHSVSTAALASSSMSSGGGGGGGFSGGGGGGFGGGGGGGAF
ncbi:MAG: DUF2207 domain-containing protein [Atopobiaceae bacterium]|nr:DUF2207 domain-containing protein [Atopobiaceae bacterium]MCH4180808.1 DUF2207 domain-containing protein [Atopobiaceae bacterium]MCH4214149.1 DUF2207 domain-containing protein [Atopobiaceae bacterium]MCH4229677.1 DUF2207 domain-containing protein [Atopobiaceae bacterium]MCH4276501.1 DUF2207 domain-containing protein [Atopobiaceae bacterium]